MCVTNSLFIGIVNIGWPAVSNEGYGLLRCSYRQG